MILRAYLVLCFVKSLPWLGIETYVSKLSISFYRNIAILYTKMSRVTWALKSRYTDYLFKVRVLGF